MKLRSNFFILIFVTGMIVFLCSFFTIYSESTVEFSNFGLPQGASNYAVISDNKCLAQVSTDLSKSDNGIQINFKVFLSEIYSSDIKGTLYFNQFNQLYLSNTEIIIGDKKLNADTTGIKDIVLNISGVIFEKPLKFQTHFHGPIEVVSRGNKIYFKWPKLHEESINNDLSPISIQTKLDTNCNVILPIDLNHFQKSSFLSFIRSKFTNGLKD